jgi:hypothetical protein
MSLPKVTINLQEGGLGRYTELGAGKVVVLVPFDTVPDNVGEYGEAVWVDTRAQAAEITVGGSPRHEPLFDTLFGNMTAGSGVYIVPVPVTEEGLLLGEVFNYLGGYAERAVLADKDITRLVYANDGGSEGYTSNEIETIQQWVEAFYTERGRRLQVFLPYIDPEAVVPIDYTVLECPDVALFVDTANFDLCGALTGKLASNPIMRAPGRVKDGPLKLVENTLQITGNALTSASALLRAWDEAGLIVPWIYPAKPGVYFGVSHNCSDPDGDYGTVELRGVINKAARIAYDVYANELLDEVEITADGKMHPGVVKWYQSSIETAINNQMVAGGEISSVKAFIDDTQNVLSTGKIVVTLKVVPVGYATEIIVNLGFTNPANA